VTVVSGTGSILCTHGKVHAQTAYQQQHFCAFTKFHITELDPITVRHGSADTVVRAMNDSNGKCRFSGSDSSETLWRIFKKIGTVDYVGDPTTHANVGVNRFQGGVSAHAWNCRRQASIFLPFLFLGPMRIAAGRPVGPINAVNGSNDASCWHSYSFYGLDNKN